MHIFANVTIAFCFTIAFILLTKVFFQEIQEVKRNYDDSLYAHLSNLRKYFYISVIVSVSVSAWLCYTVYQLYQWW